MGYSFFVFSCVVINKKQNVSLLIPIVNNYVNIRSECWFYFFPDTYYWNNKINQFIKNTSSSSFRYINKLLI